MVKGRSGVGHGKVAIILLDDVWLVTNPRVAGFGMQVYGACAKTTFSVLELEDALNRLKFLKTFSKRESIF